MEGALWEEGDFDFEDSNPQGPTSQIINALGIPFLAALISTGLLLIPKLEKIPIIGFFKKSIGFVSVVSWLVTVVIFVIMANTKNVVLSFSTQISMVIGIVSAAIVFNIIFALDKEPKTMTEVLKGVKGVYFEGLNEYNGKNLDLQQTETFFTKLLSKMSKKILRIPEDELSLTNKNVILDIVDPISNTRPGFIKAHDVMVNVSGMGEDDLKWNIDTTDDENLATKISDFLAYDPTGVFTVQADIGNYTLYKTYITELETYYLTSDATKDKSILVEAVKKIKMIINGDIITSWPSPPPSTVSVLRTALCCGTSNFEQFTQKTIDEELSGSTSETIQDIIDNNLRFS